MKILHCFILFSCVFISVKCVVFKSPQEAEKNNVTGKIKYVCALYRERDPIIDDKLMPDLLTFCACVVVSKYWVLTAKQCYAQEEWFVSVITTKFTNTLPNRKYKIKQIIDKKDLCMIQVDSKIEEDPIELAKSELKKNTKCSMYSFSTRNKKPVPIDANNQVAAFYYIWEMEGGVLETKVLALEHKNCIKKHNGVFLSPYKQKIQRNTLCIDPIKGHYWEPCSFDRGSPIVCNGKLQGILVNERELPEHTEMFLPTGCYGAMVNNYSVDAESIDPVYYAWIFNLYHKEPEDVIIRGKASQLHTQKYILIAVVFVIFVAFI